ncbi:MAG: GGDEF domain-containing protein [Wenzhouxiangellaceae bacterium]|nr:GGDEF domain-containing protein [Wenzhouxiangellaceae bacterium]
MSNSASKSGAANQSDGLKDPIIESLYRAAFDASPSSMAILDSNGDIRAVNQAWLRFSIENAGRADAYLGCNYLEIIPAGDAMLDHIRSMLSDLLAGRSSQMELEYPCHSPTRQRWFLMRAIRFRHSANEAVLVIHTDITSRRIAEQAAREASETDALTGLLNRRSFFERARQILLTARRLEKTAALLFVDLDKFKLINDQHGHAAGDAVLVETARRLSACVRNTDAPARLGGDEFVALCMIDHPETTSQLAERLLTSLTRPIRFEEHNFKIQCSIGVAQYPMHAETLEQLLELADQMMYRAKSRPDQNIAMECMH